MGRIETDRFVTVDEDGNEYILIRYQAVEEDRPLSGPSSIRRRLPDYVTDTGLPVTPIDKETFKILGPDKIVRKI